MGNSGNGSWYLIVTDYFSRYPEIAKLERLTSEEVILHCKSIFARHGIPNVVRSDNGPQFEPINSSEFSKFSKSYGFHHITSSPRYPQSNGFIESSVKTIKLRLKKAEDPYLALMAYRATPLENGLSPAELLMNRRIRTTLPIARSQLEPKIENRDELQRKEEKRIERQRDNYNKSHGVRDLKNLDVGDGVWITDKRATGTVQKRLDSPRSYIVKSGKRLYRRNRMHLVPSTNFQPEADDVDDLEPDDSRNELPISQSVPSPTKPSFQNPHPSCNNGKSNSMSPKKSQNLYTTRSGRVVRPPQKMNL